MSKLMFSNARIMIFAAVALVGACADGDRKVECQTNFDCTGAKACVQHQCVPVCVDDSNCPNGQVCDVNNGICVEGTEPVPTCPQGDPAVDADADGTPDACDVCAAGDDAADADTDGTPDACDVCAAGDDGLDLDTDGTPDACDDNVVIVDVPQACQGTLDQAALAAGNYAAALPVGCELCALTTPVLGVLGIPSDDADSDTVPDVCDVCALGDDRLDSDGDAIPDACDACVYSTTASEADRDGDGVADCVDNCPNTPNADQANTDGNGGGDACDPDNDDDGVLDGADSDDSNRYVCRDADLDRCDDCTSGTVSTSNDGADFDGDGQCDAGDSDDDNDGVADANDTNPHNASVCGDSDGDGCEDCVSGAFNTNADGLDFDADGLCDSGDADVDGDGVDNVNDNCPTVYNAGQDVCACSNSAMSCDDGNVCNGVGTCSATGVCVVSAALVCNDDGNPCTDNRCDPALGCVATHNDANACDDDNVCNGVSTCSAGACVAASPLVCNDDGNPCTDNRCDPALGCVATHNDTNACDDGNACTQTDACSAGVCVGGNAVDCGAATGGVCYDAPACNTTTGQCDSEVAKADGTACDTDGDVCNGVDTCQAGACTAAGTGGPACDTPPDPCHTTNGASCDPVVGCVYPAVADSDSDGACDAIDTYFCVPTGADDTYPLDGQDANCDGIDGNAATAYLVATAADGGVDCDKDSCGTMAQPFASIQYALDRAKADGKLSVFVAQGNYDANDTIVVPDGVSIFGGFTAGFGPDKGLDFDLDFVACFPEVESRRANISVAKPRALRVPAYSDASGDAAVDGYISGLKVVAANATDAPEPSSRALVLGTIDGQLAIRFNTFVAGNGLDGLPGADGAGGTDVDGNGIGAAGGAANVNPWCQVDVDPPIAGAASIGGQGGSFNCEIGVNDTAATAGGAGGDGVCGDEGGAGTAGITAGDVTLGVPGGGGAVSSVPSDSMAVAEPCATGGYGNPGGAGVAGDSATAAAGQVLGSFYAADPAEAYWVAGDGAGAGAGAHGGPGGGGAAASCHAYAPGYCAPGGFGCSLEIYAAVGGSGGGGGSGGCGAQGGQGGQGAGGSFAVVVTGTAPGVVLANNTLQLGAGGTGGQGGAGGAGSAGGTGGTGGASSHEQSSSNPIRGGTGGNGGAGGNGGCGQGGAGGAIAGYLVLGDAAALPDATYGADAANLIVHTDGVAAPGLGGAGGAVNCAASGPSGDNGLTCVRFVPNETSLSAACLQE